ncbi:MAG TPA: IclR family transcriptional regulator [Bordetella sp.]|nr:IclR family transcriptional regulator [Bordetella sp.]
MNNTLLKGLAVIELLAHSERPLALTEIAVASGLAKSNVHRLLQALLETRYVVRDEGTGRYTGSIKLWELGSAVLGKLDLRTHAEHIMETLLDHTRETVHLSVLDGMEVVYVHKLDSPNPVRAYTQIGGRAQAYCVATGKAMLAFRAEPVLQRVARQLHPYTARTHTDPARFLQEMRRVRAQGYAVNRGEWNENVYGVAAPIRDASGRIVAALGLSGPQERLKPARIKEFAGQVAEAAAQISDSLGWRQPAWSA